MPPPASLRTSAAFAWAVGARPLYLPSPLAFAMPSRCRPSIISRSNSAIHPTTLRMSLPVGVLVSRFMARTPSEAFRFSIRATISQRLTIERAKRSILVTTKTPGLDNNLQLPAVPEPVQILYVAPVCPVRAIGLGSLGKLEARIAVRALAAGVSFDQRPDLRVIRIERFTSVFHLHSSIVRRMIFAIRDDCKALKQQKVRPRLLEAAKMVGREGR